MFLAGILMASTNLLFTALAWSGKSEWLFAVAVIFDDIAAAFATVAFVAFNLEGVTRQPPSCLF